MKLDTEVTKLTGVGPIMAQKMQRLGIETVRDLLFYYPWRYDDFSHSKKISELRINDEAVIKGRILQIKESRTRRRWMSIIEALISDDSGEIKAIWFNQSFLKNVLKPRDEWLFSGKVQWDFKSKTKTIIINQFENPSASGAVILPVYSETEGITSKYLRKLIKPLVTNLDSAHHSSADDLQEYLPERIIKDRGLIDLSKAIKRIHFPANSTEITLAKKRLAFDELFMIMIRMCKSKKELHLRQAVKLRVQNKDLQKFVKGLAFKLTNAQRRVAWEIICDMKKSEPMNRLLEGDVGSGKTVVAAMAVLSAALSGYQTVWLAPTEILANQHFQNVSALLSAFPIKVGRWTAAKKEADLKNDDLIIGTHALIQKNIFFKKLALIIVDEQHRFGVKQRAQLKHSINGAANSKIPHFLSMTATPIPRTLALAFYGDLDLSIINELPPGRQKIITKVIHPEKRNQAYEFIKEEIENGRQAFVICPLIEEIKTENRLFDIDRKSAVKEHEKLSKEIFPELKVGLLHGKMKSKEKELTMTKFKNKKIDILVSTAVIEVGIDIANATIMMIESAERFGLAQLHQFRGRVGRSKFQSYCFLFSESWSAITKKRLNAMVTHHNGFDLAQIDLELRGPGDLAGIRQSGLPDLKMASLTDRIMIEAAKTDAEKIINLGLEKYPKLLRRYEKFILEKHLE